MRAIAPVLALIGLVLAGCGSTAPATHAARSHTTPACLNPVPIHLPLPYDSEENAFMGNPDTRGCSLHRSGCFAVVVTFDQKSQEVCDCAYRRLRAEGYPASQLAAVASTIGLGTSTVLGPQWFNVPITACWADLDGNS